MQPPITQQDVEQAIRTLSEWLISEYRRAHLRKEEVVHRTAPVTPRTTSPRKLLDVPGLAEYLSVPKGTIYTDVCMRKIPQKAIVKLGRSLRFDIAAIDAWVEENRGG